MGPWVAISSIASSLRIRPRGWSRVCAVRSRQAAAALKAARYLGVNLRGFSRRQDFLRIEVVGRLVGQGRHLLGDPAQPPRLLQPVAELGIERGQMGDVGQGVGHLRVRQGPARPVGEPARLVEVDLQHLAHQGVIGDLLAEPGRHPRHLGVEQGRGDDAEIVEDLHVLARGVEHLDHLGVGQHVEQRLEVEPRRQGVDVGRVGLAGHLDQAQFWPVGGLAHEFGIDGDKGLGVDPFAERLQCGVVGDWSHRLAIARFGAR